MPHYAYARQDRVALPREPISAKLVADLCPQAGADHVIAVNLHSDQEQGFFDFPVDNLNCLKLFTDYFKEEIKKHYSCLPDAGGAKDAKNLPTNSAPHWLLFTRRARAEQVLCHARCR